MKNYRLFVEKKPGMRVEAESLRRELNANLKLGIGELRLLCVYDLFGFTEELLRASRYRVFGERATDTVREECPLMQGAFLAWECLPGQFDQRAASAVECVRLIDPEAAVRIRSGRLLLFDRPLSPEGMEAVRRYCINAVECREKELAVLREADEAVSEPVPVLAGFRRMEAPERAAYCRSEGLAMNADDLGVVVDYFRREGRDPSQAELRILDTYWSDHCRHTTFTTCLDGIAVEPSPAGEQIARTLDRYREMRRELGRDDKPLCLMDLATIGARWLRSRGLLDDLEVSEENNACSIFVDVDADGATERWLLQFKNETHNHPTEIEPFGGASTCLGGAIRDPLSGRSYVYQAMRVTGAGDIWQPVSETLRGKLPQRVISLKAAAGYSSYGNQIGLATTHVREIYDDGYVAKRLEVGAVVGAVRADRVRRESPQPGDVVLLLGGRTGRDGVGGATGSSRQHDDRSLETCGSEVQKGNAPEERKLQRLFRRPEVTRMIKKANDFGAGGVSVAIGELTDGLDIWLDRVPTKYSGLSATEIAISESQERMAVVVEAADAERFMACCAEENIEATHVADVTDTRRLRMFYRGETVVDLDRALIDSAGARHSATTRIAAVGEGDPFRRQAEGAGLRERFEANLRDRNVLTQKGLVEMFDASIGASTVLMPYGGRRQRSETQVSVQKLPTDGFTHTASMMAFGYNPSLTAWSPYHGAAYAVVEAAAKVVAAGGSYARMRYSYQEYFGRMTSDPLTWGRPLAALLGALRMQEELGLPSIGGKDSMSGTFGQLDVPPMLMAFGITTVDARRVISTDLKRPGDLLYLVRHQPLAGHMPDTASLMRNFRFVEERIAAGQIVAGYAVGFGGVGEALAKMAFGNGVGAEVTADERTLFDLSYGSIVVESTEPLDFENAVPLGRTVQDEALTVNGERMALEGLWETNTARFAGIYPLTADAEAPSADLPDGRMAPSVWPGEAVGRPVALLPVFPGTNCDYDTARALRRAGAEVVTEVFRNLTADDIVGSIDRLARRIDACHLLVLSGGFSAGDEPDGSGKFIASVLCNDRVAAAIGRLRERGGLILGICNGFQALVKSGLLPYGRLGEVAEDAPTLFRNDINRHISQVVLTRVSSTGSPWLAGFAPGELHAIAVSHGEGKFVVDESRARALFAAGQVAFRYAMPDGEPASRGPWNPNGSCYAIEGVLSPDGRILGKMGHTERYEPGLMKNIAGEKEQPLFRNAVAYFRKQNL